jgi:energy-converting hydrogenase B subunit D
MVWQLELALFGMLIVASVVALQVRDLLAAVAALTTYSLFMALLIGLMGAVDVALTEVALGAGITGVLFIVSIFAMDRRSLD